MKRLRKALKKLRARQRRQASAPTAVADRTATAPARAAARSFDAALTGLGVEARPVSAGGEVHWQLHLEDGERLLCQAELDTDAGDRLPAEVDCPRCLRRAERAIAFQAQATDLRDLLGGL